MIPGVNIISGKASAASVNGAGGGRGGGGALSLKSISIGLKHVRMWPE